MPPQRRKRWRDADISRRTSDSCTSMLKRLQTLRHDADELGNPIPVDVRMTPDARRAWIAFYNEHAKRQEDTRDGDLAAAFSKLEGYAARLALLCHYVSWAAWPEHDDDTVGLESFAAGVTLAEWFCDETERLYGVFAESAQDRERRKLAEFIRARGGKMTARQLMRSGPCFKTAADAKAALDELTQVGLGRF